MVFSTLNGVLYGLLLFTLSSGLTLIFPMMGVLNFAHASFYMLGACFAYSPGIHVGFWPALSLAPPPGAGDGPWPDRFRGPPEQLRDNHDIRRGWLEV